MISCLPWAAAALLAIAVLACGRPPCTADGQFGSCCGEEAECPTDLGCLGRFPGGLCSRECIRDNDCPDGGSCVRVVSKSQGDLGTVCLVRCGEAQPPCRADYKCRQTSDPDLKICFPD